MFSSIFVDFYVDALCCRFIDRGNTAACRKSANCLIIQDLSWKLIE